ncbi:hypothetical protein B0A49_07160 [Cryomyces minteri]|uniref:Uncharacterized protein n=1 Tax=Cryomyces minteri TaxID=331657 RepID=A0A4U0WRA8_9PEZI|nr:hypothetical protein B0A49_07160 [Cryomyces minteri]
MTEPEELDEDFFADLYEGDDNTAKSAESAPEPIKTEQEAPKPVPSQVPSANGATTDVKAEEPTAMQDVKHENNDQAWNNGASGNSGPAYDNTQVHSYVDDDDYRPVGIKEDG